jgi:hypothetical protein
VHEQPNGTHPEPQHTWVYTSWVTPGAQGAWTARSSSDPGPFKTTAPKGLLPQQGCCTGSNTGGLTRGMCHTLCLNTEETASTLYLRHTHTNKPPRACWLGPHRTTHTPAHVSRARMEAGGRRRGRTNQHHLLMPRCTCKRYMYSHRCSQKAATLSTGSVPKAPKAPRQDPNSYVPHTA